MTGKEQMPDGNGLPRVEIDIYGVKLSGSPDPGDGEDPKTWKEVAEIIHAELKRACVGVFRLITASLESTTSILRGIGGLPGAVGKRIEHGHSLADRRESRKQSKLMRKLEAKPSDQAAREALQKFLQKKQVEGHTVRVFSDGKRAVVCILKPMEEENAQQYAALTLAEAEKMELEAKQITTASKGPQGGL